MTMFKTEVSCEKVKILIISDHLSFGLKLKKTFEKELATVTLVQSRRIIEWMELKKKIFPRKFEKIIYCVFDQDVFSLKKRYLKIFNFLKKRTEKKFFISRFLTPIKNQQKIFERWHYEQDQIAKLILEIYLNFPKSNILLANNLVFLENPNLLPLSFFFSFYKDGIINDLSSPLSLISDDDFIVGIKRYLFSPFSNLKILIKNQDIESSQIVRFARLKNNFRNINYHIFHSFLELDEGDKGFSFEEIKVKVLIDKILLKILTVLPPPRNILDQQNDELNMQNLKSKASFNQKNLVLVKKEELFDVSLEDGATRKEKLIIAPIKKDKIELKANILLEDSLFLNKKKQKSVIERRRIVEFKSKNGSSLNEKRKKRVSLWVFNKKTKKTFFLFFGKTLIFFLFLFFIYLNFFYPVIIEKRLWHDLIEGQGTQLELTKIDSFLIHLWKKQPKIERLVFKQKKLFSLLDSYLRYQNSEKEIIQWSVEVFKNIFVSDFNLKQKDWMSADQLDFQFLELLNSYLLESGINFETKKKTVLFNYLKRQQLLNSIDNNVISLWKDFSQKERQNYLFLLQNEQEIRSFGGIIEIGALLSFYKGKIIDIQILNHDDFDASLGGNLETSSDWQRITKLKKVGFQDFSFETNFATIASRSALVAQKTFNKPIDGVFSLNLKSISNLLDSLGTVEITSLKEKINKDNLFDRFLFYADNSRSNTGNFEFAKLFLQAFFNHFSSLDEKQITSFWQQLLKSLEEKNIFLHSFETTNNSVWKNLNWDGNLLTPSCPLLSNKADCLSDSLIFLENNLSGNRVNQFIKNYKNLEIDIATDSVKHSQTIVYQNDANSYTWPLGDYQFLGQLFLSPKATNVQLFVDGKKNDTLVIDKNKNFIKILFNEKVFLGGKKEIKINYDILVDFKLNNYWQWSFFQYQQPLINPPFDKITISYPVIFKPVVVSPQATLEESNRLIVFEWLKNNQNVFINVLFDKKN